MVVVRHPNRTTTLGLLALQSPFTIYHLPERKHRDERVRGKKHARVSVFFARRCDGRRPVPVVFQLNTRRAAVAFRRILDVAARGSTPNRVEFSTTGRGMRLRSQVYKNLRGSMPSVAESAHERQDEIRRSGAPREPSALGFS